MNKLNKFLSIVIILLCSHGVQAQFQCETIVDQQYLQQLDALLASQSGCVDDYSTYDLNQSITFNLVLNYAREGSGSGELTSTGPYEYRR
ncbi:MAG: hypothetical protein ACI86M_003548 [Saprospiraceae bacterium]|jgi:hypothetical protein